jgi:cell division septation protein DedD
MLLFRKLLLTALLLAIASPPAAIAAANAALDNILISKTNGVATIQIWPACRMRYVDHSPFDAGVELRIRVSMSPECDALLDDIVSERYSPSSLRLGGVEELVFERFNPRDTFILLRFKSPQKFEIRQHSVGWIEVYVDTNVDSASLPAATAKPPPQANPPATTSSMLGALATRPARPSPSAPVRPSNRVNVPPSSSGDFVVQLGVFEDADRAVRALVATSTSHFAYRTDLVVNDRSWHGLQLGFFDSEAAAEQVADQLRDDFPDAWVRYVDQDEANDARTAGDLRDGMQDDVVAVRVRSNSELSGEQITALVAEGRRALLEQRYDDAVRQYTRALEAPSHPHRAEAREMLGIAFERSGRSDNAIAEYRVFLDEFPEELGAARVGGRLSALETAYSPPTLTVAQNKVNRAEVDSWQIFGGVSSYYWRNQEQFVHDGNYLVSSSGVLNLGDISASRRGKRFDVLARLNGAYQLNLLEFDETGDIGWVSTAFIDIKDNDLGLRGRFGRQNRREDGVLGRFDGAGLSYQWKHDLHFSMSAGIPVDSPRYISDSDRNFYAASARVENLWNGRVSASAYTQHQVVDGISDRQAVGGEVYYRGDALSVFSLLDFDVSYSVLNTALVNATWQLDNGWSLSGRMDFGAQPYLTTRNALAGQTASTVDELLDTFSEAQVRRLARHRTAQATALSIGISAPVGEKFDLSLDASMRQLEATVASGGVDARPDTGSEFFLNATMVATSLLLDNDLLVVSLRHDALRTSDVSQLMLDSRLPVGRSTRISPRLIVTHRETSSINSTQLVVTPSVRILLRWGNILFDLEAGGRWSNRVLPELEFDPFTPDGTEELLGGFVNLGYRWEF